jgi:ligand-binding sensor domain-containing protein
VGRDVLFSTEIGDAEFGPGFETAGEQQHMKRGEIAIPTITFLSLLILAGGVSASEWETYTNQNEIGEILYLQGRIWGATSGGGFVYDPASGELSSITNTEGLRGLDVTALEADTLGEVWFASSEGYLSKFDTSGFFLDRYLFEEKIGPTRRRLFIYDLKADGNRLWVAHDLGLSLFLIENNGGEIKETAQFLGSLPGSEDVLSLEVTDSLIWAGTAVGVAFADKYSLNIQNPGSWRSYDQGDPHGLTNFHTNSILKSNQEIYLGTGDGVFRFNISGADTSWQGIGLGGAEVTTLTSANGILTALTDQGIYEYTGGGWQAFPTDSLPRREVTSLVVAGDGRRWVSMDGEGMAYYDARWRLVTLSGPLGNKIKDVKVAPEGEVWFVCEGRGLSILSGGEWENYTADNSPLVGTGMRDLDFDQGENAWLASWGTGLFKITPEEEWSHFDSNNSPLGWTEASYFVALSKVKVDRAGNVWILNYNPDNGNSFLILTPDSTWIVFNKFQDEVFSNWLLDLQHAGDTVYFGGLQGFEILDNGGTLEAKSDDHWRRFTDSDGLEALRVNCLARDLDGIIWIGTSGGLNYYDPVWDYLDTVTLPGDLGLTVNCVLVDGLSQKWVGTSAGLGKLSPDNTSWEIYTTTNSSLVHDQIESLEMDEEEGVLWIGTLGGVSRFETGLLSPSQDLSDISVYPNPVKRTEGERRVYFSRVPRGAKVRVYTVAGEKVREFVSPNEGGFTSWDLTNDGGEAVAGGVYLFNISSEGYSTVGKIAVIR